MTRVLVFRPGSLGDTLVAVPALWAVREHFAGVPVTLLTDRHPERRYVLATDLLRGSGIVDDFLAYSVAKSRGATFAHALRLLWRIRRTGYDTLVYLAPSVRTPAQRERDRRFFALAGIRRFVGLDGFAPPRAKGAAVIPEPTEGRQLLARLAEAGVPVPAHGGERHDLGLGATEEAMVAEWRAAGPDDGGRTWVAVGPGGKQPVNVWPPERYAAVVQTLIDRHDVWPVVFGGPEDRALGDALVAGWRRGRNAAGALGVRSSIAAMRRCRLHVGNDTGTVHMAAAAGVRVAGIYSARNPPGRWWPAGEGHIVLQRRIECEGCRLSRCVERERACILGIGVDEVVQACERLLVPGRTVSVPGKAVQQVVP